MGGRMEKAEWLRGRGGGIEVVDDDGDEKKTLKRSWGVVWALLNGEEMAGMKERLTRELDEKRQLWKLIEDWD